MGCRSGVVWEDGEGMRALVGGEEENGYICGNHKHPTRMKQIKVVDMQVPLKLIRPHVEPIKKYFGLSHPNLELELLLLDRDPDRMFKMPEYIRGEEIKKAFKKAFPDEGLTETQLDFLWLVANLYFYKSHDNYEFARREESGDFEWYPIEQDLLKLYSFFEENTDGGELTLKIGKRSLQLDNEFAWLQSVFKKQVFPKCLPGIHSKAEADALTAGKKAGRPTVRTKENAIVCGLADYFSDEGLIKERAPKSLCEFAKKYLEMMWLIEDGDQTVDEDWIKAQINHHKKNSKDARFWTPEIRSLTLEEMGQITDPMSWIF